MDAASQKIGSGPLFWFYLGVEPDSSGRFIGDIRKLLTFDLEGHCIAGVQDTDEDRFQKFENYHQYINAGVLLMDLKKWRAMDYTRKCFDFGRQPSRNIIYADQCIINSVLADDLTKLPPRWNRFIRGATKIVTATPPVSASEDARIVHYVGAEKPWQAWCTSPDPEYYWTYVTASPWKGAAPVAPVTVNQHHSMARKQMAAGDFEQAGESYERVVTHLLAKSVTRNSQAAWHANRDPQP